MEEISLKELIESVLKGKWIIITITIICLIAGLFGTIIFTPYLSEAKIIISLNYPGVENGLNPDGTKFDINKITSPVVIERALGEADIESEDIRLTNIKKNIDVEPIVPNDVVAKIENMREQGKDYIYHPNEFTITYKIPRKGDISKGDGRKLLDALVDSYEKYFQDLYYERSTLSSATGSMDYEAYDYPEIVMVMSNQIDIMDNYLKNKVRETDDFRSHKTGFTFGDLKEMVSIIDTVEINRINSIVDAFNLTKDKEKLIMNYQNRIKLLELEKAKKESESETAREMMDIFKLENTKLVVPGFNNENMNADTGSTYYDTLAERATDAAVDAGNKMHDIDYYKNEIERLRNDEISSGQKQSAIKDVEKLIDNAKIKLDYWIKAINDTAFEYYEKQLGKAITTLSPAVTVSVVNFILNLAISLVIGLMLGVFVVFFKEYWKNEENIMNNQEEIQQQI